MHAKCFFRASSAWFGKLQRPVVAVQARSHSTADMKLKLALCQFKVTPEKEENYETAKKAVEEAAATGASLVVLPEIWNSAYETPAFPKNAEDVDGGKSKSASFLADLAKKHGITLIGGSIPEAKDGKTYNTCLTYSPQGDLLGKFAKIHLFDIDIPGKQTFKESDTLTAGSRLAVLDVDSVKIGIGICYDLRFGELARAYAKRGCQLLVYPGAFNRTTGPLHWELLQRARAVDNQLFVATCSPANNPDASYGAHGHSMVISPWGEVLAKGDADKPCVVYAELDLAEIETRRKNMPLEYQRRTDLFEFVDKL